MNDHNIGKPEFDPVEPRKGVFLEALTWLGRPIMMVCDPVAKACFPVFKAHWEERYKKRYPRHAAKLLVLDILLLAFVGTLASAAIFVKTVVPVLPVTGAMALRLGLPERMVSGEDATIDVAYENETGQTVADASASVVLPTWFVAELPKGNDGAVLLPVGEVKAGASGTLHIKGKAFAASGDMLRTAARMTYWKTADSEPNASSTHAEKIIDASVARLHIDAPDRITVGQQTVIGVSVVNNGSETLHDIAVSLAVPADFVIIGRSPSAAANEWRIGEIAPGATARVGIAGYERGWGEARGAFHASAFIVRGNDRLLLERASLDPRRVMSGFEFGQTLVEPANGIVSAGGKVHLRFAYRNGGAHVLRHAEIWLPLESPYGAFFWISHGWDETSNPELGSIAPGAEGTIDATIDIKPELSSAASGEAPAPILSFSPYATFAFDDAPTKTVFIDSAPISVPVATTLSLEARAAYYIAGEQMGRGPLPPKKGETTKVRILLSVANGVGATRGTSVEARVPKGIEWTGRSSVTAGSAIDFLPSSRTVRWRLDDLSPFAGMDDAPIAASFELAITPESEKEADTPVLLEGISVSGIDALTGTRIIGTAPDVALPKP